MRILITLLSVGFAGTERHAMELAGALARHHEVAVLLRQRPTEPHRQAQYKALRAAVPPGLRVFLASRAMPAFGLWRAIARFRPTLIHAHHERSARIAGRFAIGTRLLATVHVHYRPRDFSRCDGLIFLTAAEAAAAAGYPGPRFVVGNWASPVTRPDAATLQALRDELGLSPDDFVVGSVARLEPVKGMAGLIEAFHAARLPRGRLILVGEGSERTGLQRLCQDRGLADRVVFAGFRPDVRRLYCLFDACVLNSLDEPYGLAILEAAAAGVPVIASDTIGARAIAAELPIRLVPVGATETLAAALRETVASRPAPFPRVATIEDRLPAILEAYRCIAGVPAGCRSLQAAHVPPFLPNRPEGQPGA